MNDRFSEESPSFRDPMASRMEAAQKRREELKDRFPQVEESYEGFYHYIDELDSDGSAYLLGPDGIVGSELQFNRDEYALLASDGTAITHLKGKTKMRLGRLIAEQWTIKPLICATYYRSDDKRASADIAFICWAPLKDHQEQALAAFARNIAGRLASGDRADLKLTQDQLIKVIESEGSWFLTPTLKREPLERGTVVYKGRRTGTERLTAYALRHRAGCNVLATIFWLALIFLVISLVWTNFFS